MVRDRPSPNRVLFCRRRHLRRVFRPHLLAVLLPRTRATRPPRQGARDRHEYPVPAVLDAVRDPPRLVAGQAHVHALR